MTASSPHAKVLLVTGAAQRIGAQIVQTAHMQGWQIAIHCRNSMQAAEKLCDKLHETRPNSAALFQGDLAQEGVPDMLIQSVLAHFGRLDGLVNNASSFFPTPFGKIRPADWENLIGSNLKAPLFLAQAAAPALIQTRGAIVNIIDIHAERPLRHYVPYTSAKAGLQGLTRALALELAPHVRVNGIAPGVILWPEDGQFSTETQAEILTRIPLGREGSPLDIASATLFLLETAQYMTGQILNVDGGRSLSV